MAKNQFKFKLKITGFELEVEGTKEDVAAITSSVSNQLKGLTTPQILGDDTETEDVDSTDVTQNPPLSLPQKKKSSRKKSSNNSIGKQKIEPINFKNDPKKYSAPSQAWKMLQKALWILYVVKNEKNINELSIAQIVATFNTQFKQSKTINPSNVARDLGKSKQGNNALVGEDTSVSPRVWYLTSEGETFVQNLIKGKD